MSGITALLGFTAWTVVLVAIVLGWRVVEILRGRPINSWGRDTAIAVPPFVRRAEHAHLNALENLPVFAAIVLGAWAAGKSATVDAVACWVLYARIAQSLVHLSGTGQVQVFVRATFYVLQLALFIYLLWSLLA